MVYMTRQPQSPEPPRRRDAVATRRAILQSALEGFTEHGYDGIGVRDVAQNAGVSAMLVNRYFGSKEGLFTEAVDVAFTPRTVVPESSSAIAHDLAEALVARTAPDADSLDPFLLMLRSVGNPRAAEIVSTAISNHAGAALSSMLTGDDADERAMLAHSLIAGLWLMRRLLSLPSLAEADPAELTCRLESALDAILRPPQA